MRRVMLPNRPASSVVSVLKKSCNGWLNRTEFIAIPIPLMTFLSRIVHRVEDVQCMISVRFASNHQWEKLTILPLYGYRVNA